MSLSFNIHPIYAMLSFILSHLYTAENLLSYSKQAFKIHSCFQYTTVSCPNCTDVTIKSCPCCQNLPWIPVMPCLVFCYFHYEALFLNFLRRKFLWASNNMKIRLYSGILFQQTSWACLIKRQTVVTHTSWTDSNLHLNLVLIYTTLSLTIGREKIHPVGGH